MAGCSQEQGNLGTSEKCTGIIREKKTAKERFLSCVKAITGSTTQTNTELLLHKPQKKTILVLQAMYMPKVQPLLRKASPCHHCLFHTHTRKTESEV